MNKTTYKRMEEVSKQLASTTGDLSKTLISKSDFDKTLIGFVSEKIDRNDGSYRWRIQTNGVAYDIKPEMCDITEVGQRVRLFIPNHKYHEKYAEVITDNIVCTSIEINKDKIIFGYEDETQEEVAVERDDDGSITMFKIGDRAVEVKRNFNVGK